MLTEVSGDILLSKAQVIAHGVAPQDHFDSGLALSLRERFPTMYKDFRHYCKVGNPRAGETWTWGGTGGVRVTSLFTQDPPRTQNAKPGAATFHNVNHSLKEFAKEVKREGYKSIALPRLATGVGKLPWEEVKPLLKRHLGELGVPVIVYSEFHSGVEADERLG
ncbi:MAG: macro domain-containing protein [bacterium]|nr:macro domain-containing protein [bacterium]